MGFAQWWDKHGVPRMIELCCGMPAIEKLRAQVVPLAQGKVFEIGCGGGLNQPFYRKEAVTSFSGIDPSEKLLESARLRAEGNGWQNDIKEGIGEEIPFASSSFDSVVCTYTLCSVQDHAQVISELKRILKPEGKLIFLEHGRSPDANVAKWQDRVEPLWKPMTGGCHLTRAVGASLRAGRFEVEPLGQKYIRRTPKSVGWMEWGVAHRRH